MWNFFRWCSDVPDSHLNTIPTPKKCTKWFSIPAAAAKLLQSCPTLCNPTDGSPPSSPVPGILQARTLEWVAISFSNAWKWKVKVKSLSRVRLLATPWTAAYQASPSMGFYRQECWSGVPCLLRVNRISALLKRDPRSSLALSAMWGHSEKTIYEPGRGAHGNLNLLAPWFWNSQIVSNKFIHYY